MTKNEVLINHIQNYLDSGMYRYESYYLGKEDLKTIIEALKAESCDDCISRKTVIDALAKEMPSLTTPDGSGEFDYEIQITDEAFVDCMQIINELPSVQPTRPKGKWIDDCGKFYCSECKAEYDEIYETYSHTYYSKFCPNCGVDMRGEEE